MADENWYYKELGRGAVNNATFAIVQLAAGVAGFDGVEAIGIATTSALVGPAITVLVVNLGKDVAKSASKAVARFFSGAGEDGDGDEGSGSDGGGGGNELARVRTTIRVVKRELEGIDALVALVQSKVDAAGRTAQTALQGSGIPASALVSQQYLALIPSRLAEGRAALASAQQSIDNLLRQI